MSKPTKFPTLMKQLREKAGLTMRATASKSRVSRQTVLRAEKGDVSMFVLLKLMTAYKVKGSERSDVLAAYLKHLGVRQPLVRPSA